MDRRAVIQGWSQVVGGLDEGLVDLVATAAEQSAGHRPDNRLVRRVLSENRAHAAHTGLRGRRRVRPLAEAPAQYRHPSPWIPKQGVSRPGPACWWGCAL